MAARKIDTVRTPGGKRLYNVEKIMKEMNMEKRETKEETKTEKGIKDKMDPMEKKERLKIVYIRVSSVGQKNDLENQRNYMKKHYPNHEVIEDIGSGMNLNKRGLRKIIKHAIAGEIEEVVVAYRDRLARFGFELIEDLIKEYSGGKIIVINEKEEKNPEDELVRDVLQVMNIFVAKMNGLRKYKD
jgi:predicted site-specific integrase-resolvase